MENQIKELITTINLLTKRIELLEQKVYTPSQKIKKQNPKKVTLLPTKNRNNMVS